VQTTNSSSPPPLKTSGNWRRSFPHRSKREKPDRKGTRAAFETAISAFANVSFSTESAERGSSLQAQADQRTKLKADIRSSFETATIAFPRQVGSEPNMKVTKAFRLKLESPSYGETRATYEFFTAFREKL
jgi:hypothetical protein